MGKLLSLKVEGLRSLRHTALTLVDSGCTALVGPNDSGKSSILYALHFLFTPNARLAPDDLCNRFKGEAYVEGIVEIKKAMTVGSHNVSPGKYTVTRKFNDDKYEIRALPGAVTAVHLPKIPKEHLTTFLPAFFRASSELFPYELARRESSGPVTRRILSKMFRFLAPLAAMMQLETEDEARKEIAGLLKELWKSAPRENFAYTTRDQNVTYSVTAQGGRYFPLSHMGAGLQRAFSLALQIHDFTKTANRTDVLVAMDEPEVSLHPQAQRDFLHFIQQYPDAQFVYATHSPAMIDIGRPESIRTVFFSEEKQSTIVLERKHIYDNYAMLKLALGVLPSDALTYGYVNIVVEGAIDSLVYAIWAGKLRAKGNEIDLALVKFINGGGSSVPKYFEVAFSSGLPTVAILDSDRAGKNYAAKIREFLKKGKYKLLYEPTHLLKADKKEGVDLEGILPAGKLVEAINKVCNLAQPITEKDLSTNPQVKRSKNIENFLAKQGVEYDEVKTEITISVAEGMEADEIPQSVTEFFKAVSDMLSRRQEQLVSKEVN